LFILLALATAKKWCRGHRCWHNNYHEISLSPYYQSEVIRCVRK